jgi:hypothetical protein
VDLSATFVVDVVDGGQVSRLIEQPRYERGIELLGSRGCDTKEDDSCRVDDVSDKGGAHVHGAVNDQVKDHGSTAPF